MAKTAIAEDIAHRINVYVKDGLFDSHGEGILKDIDDLGIDGVKSVRSIRVYTLHGEVGKHNMTRIGGDLLADSVTQNYVVGDLPDSLTHGSWVVHVMYNNGVTDAVGQTACKGIADLGISGVDEVRTSAIYIISGRVGKHNIEEICKRLLANSVIQHYTIEKH